MLALSNNRLVISTDQSPMCMQNEILSLLLDVYDTVTFTYANTILEGHSDAVHSLIMVDGLYRD